MEKNIPVDNFLLSIILYADSTTCDHIGKTSEYLIYISLRNISNWKRNKPNSKVLVSYLPKLKAKDNIMKTLNPSKNYKDKFFKDVFEYYYHLY